MSNYLMAEKRSSGAAHLLTSIYPAGHVMSPGNLSNQPVSMHLLTLKFWIRMLPSGNSLFLLQIKSFTWRVGESPVAM
jgi:hypothetical protein